MLKRFFHPSASILMLACAGFLVAGRPAAAQCPYADSITICSHATSYTVPARGDSAHCSTGDPEYPGHYEAAGYDIPAGLVWAHEFSNLNYIDGLVAQSYDQYWIVGPASATPISGTAQLAVNGWGPCGSWLSLSFTVQGQPASVPWACSLPPLSGTLSLPVSANVGETFDVIVTAILNGYGIAQAYASARLSFSLPPGYQVVSCNGFGGSSTPARPISWGRLKTIYR